MVETYPDLPGLSFNVIRRPKGGGTAEARHPSGRTTRVGYWAQPMYEWELTYDLLRDFGPGVSELRRLQGFFLAMRGKLTGFYYRDPDDNRAVQQFIGVTDGVTAEFPVVRTYGVGTNVTSEPVTAFPGNMLVFIESTFQPQGVSWNIGGSGGASTIVFTSPPAAGHSIFAHFDYLFYVHFKDDELDFSKFAGPDGNGFWEIKKITLESLRPIVSAAILTVPTIPVPPPPGPPPPPPGPPPPPPGPPPGGPPPPPGGPPPPPGGPPPPPGGPPPPPGFPPPPPPPPSPSPGAPSGGPSPPPPSPGGPPPPPSPGGPPPPPPPSPSPGGPPPPPPPPPGGPPPPPPPSPGGPPPPPPGTDPGPSPSPPPGEGDSGPSPGPSPPGSPGDGGPSALLGDEFPLPEPRPRAQIAAPPIVPTRPGRPAIGPSPGPARIKHEPIGE